MLQDRLAGLSRREGRGLGVTDLFHTASLLLRAAGIPYPWPRTSTEAGVRTAQVSSSHAVRSHSGFRVGVWETWEPIQLSVLFLEAEAEASGYGGGVHAV